MSKPTIKQLANDYDLFCSTFWEDASAEVAEQDWNSMSEAKRTRLVLDLLSDES